MNQKFTLVTVALFALACSANAQTNADLNWSHSFQGHTTSSNQPLSINKLADGNYLFFGEWGSHNPEEYLITEADYLFFDNSKTTYKGGDYKGTSVCANALIQKIKPSDGTILWTIYSNYGYINSSCCHMAPTADGGFVAVFDARAVMTASDNNKKQLLSFVMANGESYSISYSDDLAEFTNFTEYANVVVKFTANGSISWHRFIKSDATKGSQNTYINGLAVDDDGNIYLAGNFRSSVSFEKADHSTATLTCNNTASWNGDSQKTVGELFFVKLNSNGYFDSALTDNGTVENPVCAFATIDNLAFSDGKVFFNGRAKKADAEVALELDGNAINADVNYQTFFYGSLNTDMSVDYLKTLISVPNNKSSWVMQNKNMQVVDGKVYMTGALNGGLKKQGSDAAFVSNGNLTMLKSYILRIDAATGEVEASSCFVGSMSVSTYFGVWVGADKVVTTGYDMNAAQGHVFTVLNKSNLELQETISVCNGFGIVAICAKPLQDAEKFIVANRGKGETATVANGNTTAAVSVGNKNAWGVVYMSYSFNLTPTAVKSVGNNNENIADGPAYNLMGQKVAPDTKGIIIRNGHKYYNK